MSKQSEQVKAWRKRTKKRIIEAFGGSCCICGYAKHPSALDLHHLDPDEKELTWGKIRASPRAWKTKIVPELRKCVLICSNCHREVHHGAAVVPSDAPRFNENFATYESPRKVVKELSSCLLCGKLKESKGKYCSVKCAGKAAQRFNWDSIDLLTLLETETNVSLAKKLGVSEATIRKRTRLLKNIPR